MTKYEMYEFIPKQLMPYVKMVYNDHIEFKKTMPKKLILKAAKFNSNYKTLYNYFILHEQDVNSKKQIFEIVKVKLFGKTYDYIPQSMFPYLDFNDNLLRYDNKMSDSDKRMYEVGNYRFKTDIQYYKLKRYIIKTPKSPKITLKEHIQMLFGRRCIKFAIC